MLMHRLLSKSEPPINLNFEQSIFVDDSFVGIEVEYEGSNRPSNLTHWNVVSEGSVAGYELVLNQPKRTHLLFAAINELSTISFRDSAFSERTSVHVHIDIRDLTFTQFLSFLTLCVMFERVLYKYVAPHRSGNHFCWSFTDAPGILERIIKLANASEENVANILRNAFNVNSTKYSGINLSSVNSYGSLEFRMHHGTADTKEIIRWVNILLSLKSYAKREEVTPQSILEYKQEAGISSIFNAVLGMYRGILDYQDVDVDILEGIRAAQEFVWEIARDNRNITVPNINPDYYTQRIQSSAATVDDVLGEIRLDEGDAVWV